MITTVTLSVYERNERVFRKIARDMMLDAAGGGLFSPGLKTFYKHFSLCDDAPGRDCRPFETLQLPVIRRITPDNGTLPALLTSVSLWEEGAYVGSDHPSKSAAVLEKDGTYSRMRPENGVPVSSVSVVGGHVYMMAADGKALWKCDIPAGKQESFVLSAGVGNNSILLWMDEEGMAVLCRESGSLCTFDEKWKRTNCITRSGEQLLRGGASYGGGLLLLESFKGCGLHGNLLFRSPNGREQHVAGGFNYPTHVSVSGETAFVCDFSGLHVIALEGLQVGSIRFLPWLPLLKACGQTRGSGQEFFIEDEVAHILLRHHVLLTPASLDFSVIQCPAKPFLFR